jgi:TPP-dependent pyruvate/acetoin dehydrogenase alpha subunit
VDAAATPERALLHLLKLSRHVQERMASMHRQGRLSGTLHIAMGQEGTQVGAAFALGPGDSLFATAWDIAAFLARGVSLGGVLANAWGRTGGPTLGRDAEDHGDWQRARTFAAPSTIPDASPEAAGAALAYRLSGEPRVAMGMCAEDATWGERWRRSVEASALHRLPVVWVAGEERNPSGITARVGQMGVPVVPVDGSDVRQVCEAATEAVDRARAGGGPTVIQAAASDGDPVERFSDLLVSEGTLDRAGVDAIQDRVEREFTEAYAFGQRAALPDPSDLGTGLFAGECSTGSRAGGGG